MRWLLSALITATLGTAIAGQPADAGLSGGRVFRPGEQRGAAAPLSRQWRALSLAGPQEQPVDSSSCRWAPEANAVFRRGTEGRLEVACSATVQAALHCDPKGVEPRDISLADACAGKPLVFDPASTMKFMSDVPSSLDVAWLRWPEVATPETRATRAVGRDAAFAIPVSDASFVRFTPAGLSPFTLRASDLAKAGGALLVSRGPGGELFIRAEAAVVAPIGALVSGPSTRDITFGDGRFASLTALPDGEYAVQPIYDGGIKGAAVSVQIVSGRSADVWIAAGDVGGVRLVPDAGLCESGDELDLNSLTIAHSRISRIPCVTSIGGLAPEPLSIRLVGRPDVRPSLAFRAVVQKQAWVDVPMRLPPVFVTGRVTANGKPVPGKLVNVMRGRPDGGLTLFDPGSAQSISAGATTDENGQFHLALREPGRYVLAVTTSAAIREAARDVDLVLGHNVVDFETGGGLLRVRFTQFGRALTSPMLVHLTLDGPAGSIPQMLRTVYIEPLEIAVMAKGEYRLTAAAALTRVRRNDSTVVSMNADGPVDPIVASRYVSVTVSDAEPIRALTIDLVSQRAELQVLNEDGSVAEDARVGGTEIVGPGRFSLARLGPGTPLILRSRDFGMTCHIVTSALLQTVTVPSVSLTKVELRFEGRERGGVIRGIPGATCPVPLASFLLAWDRTAPERLTIDLAPGSYSYEREGKSWRFSVPGPPVVIK